MRIDHLPALDKHLALTKSEPERVYLILSKDSYESEQAIDRLITFLLPANTLKEHALIKFEGAQAEEGPLNEAFYSNTLFSSLRVILIHDLDKAKKKVIECVEREINQALKDNYLILTGQSWPKNTTFYKTIEKKGIVLDFAELKSWEKEKKVVAWINQKAAEARKLMSFPVCQFLVKRIGTDQALLLQEIEKLICYCFEREEIKIEDVEAITSQLQCDSIWQLGEAIFQRNSGAALRIGHAFLLDGHPLLPLLRQIRSQFQTELQVALLISQGKEGEIGTHFPYMKGQILSQHLQFARNYGFSLLKKGLLEIDKTELELKNSAMDESLLLETLLLRLTL